MRLERLKICAASSGEMPVFKLKPQKNEQDGSFLLIIECGTESSSMSIKVLLCSVLSLNLAHAGSLSFLSASVRILALLLTLTRCRFTPGCEGVVPAFLGLSWPGGLLGPSSPSLHSLLVLCSDC